MVRTRARIRFRKQGDLRLIGHRDLVRLLERLFRRARIGLAMSQGFHPKPRMSFPSALALGIEGLDEVMEVELAAPEDEAVEALQADAAASTAVALRSRLVQHSVPGLTFATVEILPPGAKKAQLRSSTYQLPLPDDCMALAVERIAVLLGEHPESMSDPALTADAHETVPCDALSAQTARVRRSLEQIGLSGGLLRFRLRSSRERSAGPRDVLAALGLGEVERRGVWLTRAEVQLESDPLPSPSTVPPLADASPPTLPG